MRQVFRSGALGRPRGMGWGGRWEGGSGWGTHVNPWLIHINVWQKPLQYCKVITLQLIKINEKKKKKNSNLVNYHIILLMFEDSKKNIFSILYFINSRKVKTQLKFKKKFV